MCSRLMRSCLVGRHPSVVVFLSRQVTIGAVLQDHNRFPYGSTCVVERKCIRVKPNGRFTVAERIHQFVREVISEQNQRIEVDEPILGGSFIFSLPKNLKSKNTPWSGLWALKEQELAEQEAEREKGIQGWLSSILRGEPASTPCLPQDQASQPDPLICLSPYSPPRVSSVILLHLRLDEPHAEVIGSVGWNEDFCILNKDKKVVAIVVRVASQLRCWLLSTPIFLEDLPGSRMELTEARCNILWRTTEALHRHRFFSRDYSR